MRVPHQAHARPVEVDPLLGGRKKGRGAGSGRSAGSGALATRDFVGHRRTWMRVSSAGQAILWINLVSTELVQVLEALGRIGGNTPPLSSPESNVTGLWVTIRPVDKSGATRFMLENA